MVASERGKRNCVLSDEPSRPVIVAISPFIFLERKSCPDQRLYAYVSVFRGVIYCDSFPIVSLISNRGIFYSMLYILQYAIYSTVCVVYSTVCAIYNKSSNPEFVYKSNKIEMLLFNDTESRN